LIISNITTQGKPVLSKCGKTDHETDKGQNVFLHPCKFSKVKDSPKIRTVRI
jgi:hypothetical protein